MADGVTGDKSRKKSGKMDLKDDLSIVRRNSTGCTLKKEQNDCGEGIRVTIRMRPLNAKETVTSTTDSSVSHQNDHRRVWRVYPQYNTVIQTEMNPPFSPVPNRIPNKNFFSFDRTFDENATTRDVYCDHAQSLIQNLMEGFNCTIFAYGQTSSGKTFTMQGDNNSINPSRNDNNSKRGCEGILHMAAHDIFGYTSNHRKSHEFIIRVSYIEIYNEEVRDLLSPVTGGSSTPESSTIAIREDPRKGVFITAHEYIVNDYKGLLSALYEGEKRRHVSSTNMNERSSRSHTIFRVTVESRFCTDGIYEDDDSNEINDNGSDDTRSTVSSGQPTYRCSSTSLLEERMNRRQKGSSRNNDNGTISPILISTLNLVDLAGSESVRHTGATGERQKEGGRINQSLLTLSRVIVALGQANAHINFRDSKLTRILQPTLSGNAKMSVICCATPSSLYLEETRSTLQFAARAKMVKTNPQREEFMDDRTLLKKVTKELNLAKRALGGNDGLEKMKDLDEESESIIQYCNFTKKEIIESLETYQGIAVVKNCDNANGTNQSNDDGDNRFVPQDPQLPLQDDVGNGIQVKAEGDKEEPSVTSKALNALHTSMEFHRYMKSQFDSLQTLRESERIQYDEKMEILTQKSKSQSEQDKREIQDLQNKVDKLEEELRISRDVECTLRKKTQGVEHKSNIEIASLQTSCDRLQEENKMLQENQQATRKQLDEARADNDDTEYKLRNAQHRISQLLISSSNEKNCVDDYLETNGTMDKEIFQKETNNVNAVSSMEPKGENDARKTKSKTPSTKKVFEQFECELNRFVDRFERILDEKQKLDEKERRLMGFVRSSNATLQSTKATMDVLEHHRQEIMDQLDSMRRQCENLKEQMELNEEAAFYKGVYFSSLV